MSTPTPIPEDKLALIKEAILSDQKIVAIKLHRESTGSGLAEAKQAVEQMEAELRKATPEKFTKPAAGKGCTGVLLVLCLGLCGLAVWIFKIA